MKKKLMSVSLLLISLFMVSANAVAAVIPLMAKSMPNVNGSLIELSMTLPSLGILCMPLSVPLAEKIGIKREILIGIGVILISGIIPAFTNNIYLILLSRVALGLGTAMVGAYASSLIIKLYQGQAQQNMLGGASIIEGLAMLGMTYFAGVLMNVKWNNAFLVYLIALPILLMFWAFVPEKLVDAPAEGNQSSKKQKGSKHLTVAVILFAIYNFLFNTCFAFMTTKFAALVVERGYGTAAQASTLMGVMSLAMSIGGFLYMGIQKKAPTFSPAIAALLLLISYVLLLNTKSMLVSTIAMILAGFTLAIGMSSSAYVISLFTKPNAVAFSIGVCGSVANVGTLLTPYSAQLFATILHNNSPEVAFKCAAVIMSILFVVALVVGIKEKQKLDKKTTNVAIHTN